MVLKKKTENEKEIWKPAVGYEGLYEVSNLGRIRSLDRVVIRKNQGSYVTKGRILIGGKGKAGYTTVKLSKNLKSKTHTVHVLVMRAFVGECPDGCEVSHLTNIRQGGTNYLSNLIYCSRSCNHAFKIDDGTATIGSNHPGAKLTESQVLDIRAMYMRGRKTQYEIATIFNVCVMSINRIVNRKLWKHI